MSKDGTYKGIDYGMGKTNIDPKTGIRFGVISQHSLSPWATDDMEADYGDPTCPKCGNDAREYDNDKDGEYETGKPPGSWVSCDYACDTCCCIVSSEDAFPDEPLGHYIDEEDFKAHLDSSGDVWFTLSHFFTRAQFCSPCAPGACHLDHPMEEGEKCYCPGHDWFEGDKAPYPVYSVKTGELVPPPEQNPGTPCPRCGIIRGGEAGPGCICNSFGGPN